MLFESWAGLLAPREFTRFALPAVRRAASALRRLDVPLTCYVNQGAPLLPAVADLDVDVIGVDWRSERSQVRSILGAGKAVQGNLDPAALFALFFFQAEDGIRDIGVTGVQTCALPIW